MMKAWILESFDGIEGLREAELPEPKPTAGEVVINVEYSALNPADAWLAKAMYPANPPLPHVLGRDGIGTILSVGEGVDDWSVGQRVIVLRGKTGVERHGTFAEKASVPADSIAVKPSGWSDQQAAGASLVYLTAYQALTQFGPIKSGGTVLVTGASGGVGVAAIQLAKAFGCRTVGLSRSPEKRKTLETDIGCDETFDPQDKGWHKQLQQKANIAVDMVAGPGFDQVLSAMDYQGGVSAVGRSGGEVPAFNVGQLFFRRLTLRGVAVSDFSRSQARTAWEQVILLLSNTDQKPLVDEIFPFDKLPDAFQRLDKGPMGKVLLQVQ